MNNEDFSIYIQQTADLMGLSIDPEYLPQVIDNFIKIAAIASLVTEFPLPESIQAAPQFEP